MTEEELEKEAEESFEQYKVTDEDYVVSPYSDDMGEKMLMYNDEYYAEETYLRFYTQGYLASAEPREKRIAELEKENADLKEEINKIAFARGTLEEENAELKEQIAELSKHIVELQKDKGELIDRCRELETRCNELFLQTIQLNKAKEIIREYLKSTESWNYDFADILKCNKKAEQFIKDSEVEKC